MTPHQIRYRTCLLSNTLFARVDPSKVRSTELHLLFRGLALALGDTQFADHAVNNTYLFLYELSCFKDMLKRQKNPPTLCFGGMLTPIFLHLGIDLSQYTFVQRESEMDLPYMCSIKACGRRAGVGIVHLWKLRGRQIKCTLPMPAYCTPISETNITFRVPESRWIPSMPRREPERTPRPKPKRSAIPSSSNELEEAPTLSPHDGIDRPEESREIKSMRRLLDWMVRAYYKLERKLDRSLARQSCASGGDEQSPARDMRRQRMTQVLHVAWIGRDRGRNLRRVLSHCNNPE